MPHVFYNLLLAVVPVVLAYTVAWLASERSLHPLVRIGLGVPLGLVWLAFLPNTCYLLTEWRHLLFDPRWKDLLDEGRIDRIAMLKTAKWALFFLIYSGLGVLLFTLSIRPMERVWRGPRRHPALIAPFLFFLMALGVYLGLIERYNSWDMFRRWHEVFESTRDALQNRVLVGSIAVFAALLWGLYESVDIWVDGVTERLQRMRGGGGRGGYTTVSSSVAKGRGKKR